MSRTTGGSAELLREGSGIKVDGTAGHELTISTYIKDAGNLPCQKALPGLIYHQRRRAMSSGSGQGPGRVFSPYEDTPRYNYNQIMYRLRLDDIRLQTSTQH